MKRLIAVLLFVPVTVLAQAPAIDLPEGIVSPWIAAARAAPAAARPDQTPPAAAQPAAGPRRRPSMVGYIGNGTIESGVRLRLDAGFGMSAPDRAEVFYAKCGCYRNRSVSDPTYDPNAPGPDAWATDLTFEQLFLLGEYAPTARLSVFGELPIRFLQPQTFRPGTGSSPGTRGLSDVRAGVKLGLVSTANRQVTASVQVSAPTGDALQGLGTNHWTVEPVLLYQEHPTDRLTIEAQVGDIIPTDGSAGVPTSASGKFSGSVLYYGIGPSFEVYRSGQKAVAPVVELVGWHVLDGFQTADVADASGINVVNVKAGVRILFNDRGSFYVGYGRPLTTAHWYDEILRLEYRVGF